MSLSNALAWLRQTGGGLIRLRTAQGARPLLNLFAFYPLLFLILVLLYLFLFDLALTEYRAFRIIWGDEWWVGLGNGFAVGMILGGVLLAAHLLDQVRWPHRPTITPIPDLAVAAGTASAPVPFAVGGDPNPDTLTVTAITSDPAAVPPAVVTAGGAGRDRTVAVDATALPAGATTVVTLTILNTRGVTAADSFRVTVLPPGDPVPPPRPPDRFPPLRAPHHLNYWVAWWGLILLAAVPVVIQRSEFRVKYPVPDGSEVGSPCVPPAATGPAGPEEVESLRAVCETTWWAQVWFPLGLFLCGVLFTAVWRWAPGAWAAGRELRLARWVGVFLLAAYGVLIGAHAAAGSGWLAVRAGFPASWSVFLLIGAFTAVAWQFTRVSLQREWWLYPATFLFLLLPFLIPLLQTNYRLPGMEVYEGGPGAGSYRAAGSYYDLGSRPNLAEYQFRRKDPAGLVPDEEALDGWNRRVVGLYGKARPAVVVAVSGGASASALYTAEVLFTLEYESPGLTDQIRVISGASGGMFGAAYFVAQSRPHTDLARGRAEYAAAWKAHHHDGSLPRERFDQVEADYKKQVLAARKKAREDLGQDFLSPIMQQWVHKDMPLYFFALRTTNDRGQALERVWARRLRGPVPDKRRDPVDGRWPVEDGGLLDVPFVDLREEERDGAIPSLVLTPMMLEDGRQLIISNLDLDYMVDSVLPPQASGDVPAERPSHTGVEFYRLFPKARGFRLGTAVRMNASFPYLSPSAAIPTNPERHVVDAGYYDNYGTVTATRWLIRNVDWFNRTWWPAAGRPDPAGTPAAYLVQVRCFAYETQTRQFVTQEEGREVVRVGPGGVARTESGLFTLTAPLNGLFASWRANMVYRGDERVDAARTFFRRSEVGFTGVGVERVLFECPFEPSLNWLLTDAERRRLADGGAGMIEPDFARVREAFPAALAEAREVTRAWQAGVGAAAAQLPVPVRLWQEKENGGPGRTVPGGRREFYWRLLAQREGVPTADPAR